MAFTPFNFTKSWRNASDFPTFESDETKVRDDMQSLFDELKAGLNRLIGELKANNMPFTPTAEIDSSDVQNAIENVQGQIASAVLGELPDASITSVKLVDEAVTSAKLADEAVTSAKLADEAVTSGKLADEVVQTSNIADEAVTGDKIADGSIGLVKLSPEALNAKADLVDGKVKAAQLSRARVNVTASRALLNTDEGKILYATSPSAITITIPLNSVAQIPVGSDIMVFRAGTGGVAFVGAQGVNITCSAELDSLKQFDTVLLKKWGANDWNVEFNHNGVPDGGVTTEKLASDFLLPVGMGGTNATTAAGARVNLGAQKQHEVRAITLAVNAWVDKQQEVTCTGVTDSNVVFTAPAPASYEDYCNSGIRCVEQASGQLVFECESVPASSIAINVLLLD